MKDFIEKLISRLEEEKKLNPCRNTQCKVCKYTNNCWEGEMSFKVEIDNVVEIVNQLAEEYKGGWIPVSERFPEDDTKEYIVQKTNGLIDIIGFTKDAYKLDKYDFAEYKGKKKQLFYDCDSEYGYIEWECEAWMPLPEKYKGE